MKNFKKLLALLMLPLLLVGCIQVETIIRLKADGSGTIEKTVLISREFISMMSMMKTLFQSADSTGENNPEDPFDFDDEETLRAGASKLGAGVKFVSAEKIDTGKLEGVKAIYAFTDINQVRIDPGMTGDIPSMDDEDGHEADREEYAVIRFRKGNPARLVLTFPREEDATAEIESDTLSLDEDDDNGMGNRFKSLMKDARIALKFRVEGQITETNATFRDGSEVTLIDLEFAKFMDNLDAFDKLNAAKHQSFETRRRLMADIPGVKIELQDAVEIAFKP